MSMDKSPDKVTDNVMGKSTDNVMGKATDVQIQLIMRQTNFNYEEAMMNLIECDYDPIKVIKKYLGITEKKIPTKTASLNQEIYKQIRHKLDDSMRSYNEKTNTKIQSEIENL